ncbi:hypothetical protein [Flaviaesturariibacter aridisoli]|uniref:Uncharacterized protein n=1 Tax=Flaviaesturariibacter aridisoli TaxID=2545761 RepID=A0A4V2WMZ6_9BACT|nr:hypothetical protein [Flaviaesturariibacter aridisoli]TCZ73482.1 hypothetical protein E0486_05850 [Flaviaesturariibacter aridisoli]
MSEETQSQPNPGSSRRHRSSGGSSRHSRSRHGRSRSNGSSRRGSSDSKTKNSFTLGQALLLLWSAATLGTLLYLINDVHRAPLPAIAALTGAALLGLLFFFRGLRKKKRK